MAKSDKYIMQISHGMSCYMYYVGFSSTCAFDIALQSVADKLVREMFLKSGKSQETFFGGNPELYDADKLVREMFLKSGKSQETFFGGNPELYDAILLQWRIQVLRLRGGGMPTFWIRPYPTSVI